MTFFSSNTLERSLETFKGSVQLTKKKLENQKELKDEIRNAT